MLRGIARFAKVHIYNDQGDVLSVSRELLSIHTISGGKRIFRLPRKVGIVYDLFNRKAIARDTDHFEVTLLPASTSLYHTGDAGRLLFFGDTILNY